MNANIMYVLNKCWNVMSGNKTIVFSFILLALQQTAIINLIDANWLLFWNWSISFLAGGSFIQHVAKGSFKETTDIIEK